MARRPLKKRPRFEVSTIKSPMGTLFAVSHKEKLCALSFLDTWPTTLSRMIKRFKTDDYIEAQLFTEALTAYFDKDFATVRNLGLDAQGTPFQKKVWKQLCKIEPGTTQTYGEVAQAVGKKNAFRAVGQAANRNPIAIIVPCHRVVGHKGLLTGFAAGIDRKRWLLEHEGALLI